MLLMPVPLHYAAAPMQAGRAQRRLRGFALAAELGIRLARLPAPLLALAFAEVRQGLGGVVQFSDDVGVGQRHVGTQKFVKAGAEFCW